MSTQRAMDGFARSTDRAALSMGLSAVQQSIDRAAPSENTHGIVAIVVSLNG